MRLIERRAVVILQVEQELERIVVIFPEACKHSEGVQRLGQYNRYRVIGFYKKPRIEPRLNGQFMPAHSAGLQTGGLWRRLEHNFC